MDGAVINAAQVVLESPFSLANIPFGIISTKTITAPVPAVAIGDYALNLATFASSDGFALLPAIQSHLHVFYQRTLNAFAALGRPVHRQVREYLQVTSHLPMHIGDYTDFYAGLNHAYNVGVLFRGKENALQPNYRHMPVGYHGRASSVIVVDPAASPKLPTFSACKRLDVEIELAAFVGVGSNLGEPIPIGEAEDHLFGVVLMNDWSARDIQAWEYIPLGPFNGKNFATTVTPWVILMDALETFRTPGLEPANRESLLPYLREKRLNNCFDIHLEFELKNSGGRPTIVSKTNSSNVLFSFPQMLAHHTITGCNMNPGDLLGSGTISGNVPGTQGSLLEQTNGGKRPIKLADGTERLFLEDGDEVVLRGMCGKEGGYVGFGDCVG
ncbi:hypothetical protein V8E54_003119 [Elaphomyces granulatus]